MKLPEQPYNHLRRSFPTLSDHGVDLLNSLLTFDPRKRITAHQALRHPFFTVRGRCAGREGEGMQQAAGGGEGIGTEGKRRKREGAARDGRGGQVQGRAV